LEKSADFTGGGQINLANLTDGLRAEREQGITIDVAYRYFATPKRKFIVADTPGHVQYTRNMVTGASTANLSIVLVDARQGVIEQTPPPHLTSPSLLRHSAPRHRGQQDGPGRTGARRAFRKSATSIEEFLPQLGDFSDVKFIPMSALNGDNVVRRLGAQRRGMAARRLLASSRDCATSRATGTTERSAFRCNGSTAPNNPTDKSLHDSNT
jgi:bifunctional enzyme CysN/CysC/sulfate adenylyltransferase subunit 1